MKQVMSGNEAIARGAYEAGCHVATAYPGTPSSEILKNIFQYEEIDAEWSVNEKVAMEIAIGASMAGGRAMASMKHFGLNVASDPLFAAVYEGATGGLVIVVADDPGMNSSGTEPDTRYYAPHMKIPMLEPTDSQECKDFTKLAFAMSEEFDTPVLIRTTTRINHGTGVVEIGERTPVSVREYVKNNLKNTNIPAFARNKHGIVEERLKKLQNYANTYPLNTIEWGDKKIGIIANGISYQYAKEVFGNTASYLKIGFSYPLPDKRIREFAQKVEKLYIIEELEPYMEQAVKALGIDCIGKNIIPICLELNTDIIRSAFQIIDDQKIYQIETKAPARPSGFCSGCTHRGLYYEVTKYLGKIVATGDIGCYALSIQPPFGVTDTMIDMGGSITAGIGFDKIHKKAGRDLRVFSFIGDSTFFHSGITGLVDAVYNNASSAVFILDNRTTAMTGHQNTPGCGKSPKGQTAREIDIKTLVMGCGVPESNIRVVDPYDLTQTAAAVKEAYESKELFVVITKRGCPLLKEVQKERKGMNCAVNQERCKKCKLCLSKLACPSLMMRDGEVMIDAESCNGCTVCLQVCPFHAIEEAGRAEKNSSALTN